MKKLNIMLYYLSAPAQGSRVPGRASQRQPWFRLEIWKGASVLRWGRSTWKSRAFLSQIWKKHSKKALEFYFHA